MRGWWMAACGSILLFGTPLAAQSVVLDTAFATDGYSLAPFRGGDDLSAGGASDAQGRSYLVGRAGGSPNDSAVLRLTASGQLDTSFGAGGIVRLAASSGANEARAVAVDGSGRVLIAGQGSDADGTLAYVARLGLDGRPDPSFGEGGVRRLRGSAFGPGIQQLSFSALAVGSINGQGYRVFAGGSSLNANGKSLASMVALDEQGSLVSGFGASGLVRLDPANATGSLLRGIYYESNFEVYAVGRVARSNGSDFLLVGWRSDTGALVTRLGNPGAPPAERGYVTVNFGAGSTSEARSMAWESRGNRYLIGGYTNAGGGFDLALSKHVFFLSGCEALYPGTQNAGCLDSTFGSVTVGNPPGTRVVDLGSSLDLGGFLSFAWRPIPNSSNFEETHYFLAGEVGPSGAVGFERAGVVKLERDGTLASEFGTAGIGLYALGNAATLPSANVTGPLNAAPQPLSLALSATGANGLGDIGILRLTDLGQPQANYGNAGSRLVDVGEQFSRGYALARQADGALVVAGEARIDALRSATSLARFLPDGRLDPQFGTGGRVLLAVGSGDSRWRGLHIEGSQFWTIGEAVFEGELRSTVARFTANGSLDASFAQAGIANLDLPEENSGSALRTDAQGRLLLVGTRGSGFGQQGFLARLLPNGIVDSSFGNAGVADFGGGTGPGARGRALALDGSRILSAGTDHSVPTRFLIQAWTANGSADPSFGNGGRVSVIAPSGAARLNAMLVGSDSRVYVGGGYDSPARPLLLRLSANGTLETSANLRDELHSEVQALSFDGPNRILAAGTARPASTPPPFRELAVWRVFTDGSNDSAFGELGRRVISVGPARDSGAAALLVDPQQRIVLAGDALDTMMAMRLVARLASNTSFQSTTNPSTFGQSVSFPITVQGGAGNPVPSGNVSLTRAGNVLGSAVLAQNGTASVTLGNLPVGVSELRAQYAGDAVYASSESGVLAHIVNPAATTATLLPLSPINLPFGTPMQLRVDVNAAFATVPSGQVSVRDAGVEVLRVALSNGQVSVQLSNLTPGTHPLTAHYLGDAQHTASPASNTVLVTVGAIDAALSLSATPSNVAPNAPLLLRLEATGSVGTPTGSASFAAGGQALSGCTGLPLVAGVATCSTSFATLGSVSITASYSGSTSYNPGSAGPVTVLIQDALFANGFE